MTEYNYPGVGRSGSFCKGYYLVCNFGYHYLACKPEDKPDDPLLNSPLITLWTCATYGEQFLLNLHDWKNSRDIISQLFCYLTNDDKSQGAQTKAEAIAFVSDQLVHRQLLIIPL